MTDAHAVARKARGTMWALGAVSVALFTFAGALLFFALSRPEPFDPLGPYPVQRVAEERDRTDTPTVSLRHPVVHVTGRKCTEGHGYTISGVVAWQSVDPRGSGIVTGEATRDAVDGCETFRFRNDIPERVLAVMEAQVADGLRPLWRITGTETPINGDGEGVPLTWVTEPFRVTP